MDDLPPPLLLEILSRLGDSVDVARCRVATKTLNSIASDIRSINLYCSFLRYSKSRSPLTQASITPFKSVFSKLLPELPIVESVSIGVVKPLRIVMYDDIEDEGDDLYLSDVNFLKEWLSNVGKGLRSFSVSDFWVQSCWRQSDALSLLSAYCPSLLKVVIRNAWLSVNNLIPMPKLTKLTLEFIRLDDENLDKMNECFPFLHVLNLVGVGGLSHPKIHLMHLRTCKWTLPNGPLSITITAPSLVKLQLKCMKPNLLLVDTPSLSDLKLSLERVGNFKTTEFPDLKKLHIESMGLRHLLDTLPFGKTVTNLTVVSKRWKVLVGVAKSSLELLLSVFPNVSTLTLKSCAWSEYKMYPGLGGVLFRTQLKGLKKITSYLTVNDIEVTIATIFFLLDNCSSLSHMELFIHRDVVSTVTNSLISRCMSCCVKVSWKWGMWKEGTKDAWIYDIS